MENALFDVGAVDRNTACRKCHIDSLVGAHPNHYSDGDCSAMCHREWGPSLSANTPTVLDAAGAFASSTSQDLPAYVLHAIHSKPRWMATVTTENSKCGSCHQVAACTACHNGDPAPDATHGDHGNVATSTPIVPWVGDLSVGVTALQSEDTMLEDAELRCGAAGCHDIDNIALSTPFYMDCYTHVAFPESNYVASSASVTGSWSYLSGTVYSLQRERYSNVANSRLNVTFTGRRVTIASTRDQYRGIAEVFIDNVSQGTIDQFNGTTLRQRPVWTSGDLGPGQHTVSVRVTGTKNPLSRGTYVSLDHIAIYAAASDTVSPECSSCHVPQGDDAHGGEHPASFTFSHDMTQTIVASNTWNTGYGTYSCNQCHQTPLRNEHRRTTASGFSAPDSCSICHPVYAPTAWTDTYSLAGGCDYAQCHAVSTPRERHGVFAGKHAVSAAGQSTACSSCHAGDLRVVHNNSIPGNSKVETNGCLSCHSSIKLDTDPSCSGATCHVGGYGVIDTHAIDSATSHNASEAGKPFTRTYQATAGLDDGGKECSVCHSAQLMPAHSDGPAVGCATGGAGGKGCHMDTTYNSIAVAAGGWTSRKCSDCHDSGANQSHEDTMTPHIVGNNGCAGTGSGCHNSNDVWALHLTQQNGQPASYQSCSNAGCHDTVDRRPTISFANACGSTSTGCHVDKAVDHALSFSHTFSATSYYNGASETGCTNQTGCHNQGVAATSDFGYQFHPAAGCTGGTTKCHGSASKAAFTGIMPTDCQECHGGAFVNAASRNNLTAAPGSGGHYSETTHTAVGMGTAINAGGTASATCNNCHSATIGGANNGLVNQHTSVTIGGSPYGAALSCGECHGDSRSFGYAEVDADWTNNTCADCHAPASSSPLDHASSVPAVAEVGSSCGSTGSGCHNTTDLHALHRNTAGGCNLTGCHIYTQQTQRPTAKGCGGATSCHTGYTNSAHGPITGNESTHTAAAMTTVLDATYNAGGANTCDVCHSAGLEAAHGNTITGNLASPAWTSPMCGECHGGDVAPVTGAVNVIKTTKWPAKACDECHGGANGPAKHTEYTTGHTGVQTGYNCANAGCHNTLDLRALHNNPLTSGTTAGCDVTGCHDSANKEMQSAAKSCGTGNACHTDKTDTGHGVDHSYTAVSDYTQTADTIGSEAGCAGSGAGCHGTVGSRDGVTEFHAAVTAGCTASDACHSSSSMTAGFKSGGSGTDCVRCHDTGTWVNASDATPLSGLSPAGHYDNTLHTATSGLGNVTSGGTASAACSNCHTLELKGAHGAARTGFSSSTKGAYVTCQECHEYSVGVITEVKTGSWTLNACDDCHNATDMSAARAQHGTTAPAVPEVTTTCGSAGATGLNCHATTDLHALHKDAAGGCNLSGCHDYTKQGFVPTAKSCGTGGACHSTYTKTTHTHAADAAKHQPTTTTQATATQFGTQCGACHDIRNSNSSLTLEHALTTSAKSGNADNCLNCHNNALSTTAIQNNWSAKDGTTACSVCHTGALAIHPDQNTAAHADVTSAGCGNSGIGCHNSNDLSQVGAVTTVNTNIHANCLRCHDRTATAPNVAFNPANDTCGSGRECHGTATQYNTSTFVHNGSTGAGLADGNDAAHHQDTVMSATMTSGVASATCANCHTGSLATSHATALTGWANTCTGCHNSTLAANVSANEVKAGWTNNDCGDCHVAGASAVKIPNLHSRYASGTHDGTSTQNCGASGVGCHNTYDLAVLHGVTKANGCQLAGCHDAVDKAMGSAAKSCGSGGTCHSTYTATSHGVYTNGNDTTHTASAGMTTALTVGVATAQCSTCHSAALGTAHATASITNNLGSGHTAWTSLCAGCHNATLAPTASASTQVKDPANWSTNSCVDCHTPSYHNTYASGHTGTSTQSCGASGNACHNTYDLTVLHGQTRTNGCQVTGCHDALNKAMTSGAKSCGSGGTCHSSYTASSHGTITGNEATHTAASMTTVLDAAYNAGGANTCNVCHSSGLEAAHGNTITGNLASPAWASPMCGECHGGDVAPVTGATSVIKTTKWPAKACDECHGGANGPAKHTEYTTGHTGVESGCSSGSCHGTDLRAAHNNSVTSNAGTAGCDSTGCHDSLNKEMQSAAKSCGSTGTCHTDKSGSHGAANHDIKNIWETTYKVANSQPTTFTHNSIDYGPSNSLGCGGSSTFNGASAYVCHFSDLTKEHGTTAAGGAGRTLENGGQGCGVCHTDKGGIVGGDASQSVIQNAITANDMRCTTCHNGNETNGTASGHVTVSTTGSYQKTVTNVMAPEFRSWMTGPSLNVESSGGHRVRNDLPNWPLRTPYNPGIINGIDPGILVPSGVYTGTNPRTGATWKFGDIVLCEDCHWFNAAPLGPQGASVPFYVDGQKSSNNLPAGVTNHWYTTINSGANTPAPCNKCHSTLNSVTHRSAHSFRCDSCHVRIPHAWKRPRLMRRTTGGTIQGVTQDALPYADPAQADALIGYKMTAGMTNFQSGGNCDDNCAKHGGAAPYWP